MATTSAAGTIRSTAAQRPAVLGGSGPRLWQQIARERWIYLFIVPGALYFLVFEYLPLLGNVIAFQDYSPFLGITGSPFIGLENFRRLFTDVDFKLALVLNSIVNDRVKRTMQSIVYLPHFLSWVIVIALWQQVFGGAGFINQLLRNQGVDAVNMMTTPHFAKPLFLLQAIWKEMGWGTIIFLA